MVGGCPVGSRCWRRAYRAWRRSCMEAFVIDDEELGEDYSGLCLRRATTISTRACHVGHGLRLVSAVGMLYNAGHMDIGRFSPLTYAHDVKVFPHDAQTLLGAFSIAAVSDAGSLYRSPDLGATWTRFDHDVSVDSTLMIIAASAQSPERVYCAARRGQVFGTEDGGR